MPGRALKLTPPSWWACSFGSSSSSSEMRDSVPVMVAGLQVLTSLNITEEEKKKVRGEGGGEDNKEAEGVRGS